MFDKYKKAAMFAEFAFLGRYLQESDTRILDIKVEIADGNILNLAPRLYDRDFCAGTPSLTVYLLDSFGNEIGDVKQSGYTPRDQADPWWKHLFKSKVLQQGETVEEALRRWRNRSDWIFFVLVIEENPIFGEVTVKIHKPPKKYNLKTWLEEKKRRAADELASVLREIDKAGD